MSAAPEGYPWRLSDMTDRFYCDAEQDTELTPNLSLSKHTQTITVPRNLPKYFTHGNNQHTHTPAI